MIHSCPIRFSKSVLFTAALSLILSATGIGNPEAVAQSRSSSSSADPGPVYFEETFFPVYVQRNDTTSVTDAPGVATESGLGYDLRTTLGATLWGHLVLGLTYNLYHLKTSRPEVSGGDASLNETTSRSELGPTFGYVNEGWRFLGTLFISGDKSVHTVIAGASDNGDTLIKNTGLSGFQLTAGYAFHLFDSVEIGPSLVYRVVNYSKQSKVNALNSSENYSGKSLYSKAVDGSLSPMISIIARF